VAFEPVDFIARLAALVPKPRVNLTRYHGILAPNHRWRGEVTPARRGKALKTGANAEVRTPAECHAAMTWAQRRKRVFNIDIEVCSRCGGSVKVISPGRSFISRDATENPMARTAAGSRSGMDENELHGHLSEQLSRAIGNYLANFSSSVSRISEEI
jgi:hypothetical protein